MMRKMGKELTMGRIVHFEIMAGDPERAVRFYEEVFGWESSTWDGPMEYWLLTTGPAEEPGIDGAIMRRRDDDQPGAGAYVCTAEVDSVEDTVKSVEAAGGEGVGYHVYFRDTEGNVFGAMQSDESAGE
jgi:predicted enzyme related to lactoylglutathione lyase